MRTKERIDRAAWKFECYFGLSTEVFSRGTYRILYDNKKDEIYGWYRTDSSQLLSEPDAYQLELFFEKEV